MYKSLLITFLLSYNILFSQTGPGGVGNSSSNLVWLSSDQVSGITDGANLSSWNDLSGNGNNLTQPNSNYTPIYKTNIVNGKPTVRFNKTNGRLRKPSFTSFPSTAITEIYVNMNTESSDGILSYASSAHNNDFLLFSSNNLRIYRATHRVSGVSFNDNSWHIGQTSWKSSGGELEVWKDGDRSYTNTGHRTGTSITSGGCLSLAGEQDSPDGSYESGQAHFGDFTEVLVFNTYLNETQHIIIANYLSAKYNIALSANNLYTQDTPSAGNFDNEVAGIGRLSATDLHNDAQGSSIVRILNPSNLDNNEFLIWGHDNAILGSYSSTDFPPSLQGRLQRVWRVSETNKLTSSSADVGSIDIRFDLAGLGAVTVSDLRLLVDSDNDGFFNDETPISGAIHVEGSVYQFSAQTAIANNLRFTLGTINIGQTPLPIQLISFDATLNKNQLVDLNWTTLSEINNDYFSIEKSKDATNWDVLSTINGAGNSNLEIDYYTIDENPYPGINYYRLKQTDFDGVHSYSSIQKIEIKPDVLNDLHVYPNPSRDIITIYSDKLNLEGLVVYNSLGQKVNLNNNYELKSDYKVILNLSNQPKGIYYIISGNQKVKLVKN